MQQFYPNPISTKERLTAILRTVAVFAVLLLSANGLSAQLVTANLSDSLYCENLGGADGAAKRQALQDSIISWYNETEDSLRSILDPALCDSVIITSSPNFSEISGIITSDTLPYCFDLTVTWSFEDTCAATPSPPEQDYVTTFKALDTLGPVFTGIPNDTTINIEDLDSIKVVTGIAAEDDCSGPIVGAIVFDSVSTQGTGCDRFSFTITRSWSATDSCGNVTLEQQVITVVDNEAPKFDSLEVAGLDTISFDNVTNTVGLSIQDTLNKYRPTTFTDNSGSVPFITDTIDSQTNNGCDQDFLYQRIWVLEDSCGNQSAFIQRIFVIDTLPPMVTFPNDTIVSCEVVAGGNFENAGQPTGIIDAASAGAASVTFSATFIGEDPNCFAQDTFDVIWIVSDSCGNEVRDTQRVITIDTTAPVITTAPQDLTISCGDGTTITSAFQNWLANAGGAVATDNCSPNVMFETQNAGGGTPFLTRVCPSPNNVIDSTSVWFIAIDSCDNRDTMTAIFKVIDNVAPQFVTPATTFTQTLGTDPGECVRDVNLPLPQILEECAVSFENVSVFQSANLTGPVNSNEPVDTVVLTFDLSSLTQPINAEAVFLDYDLINMDADGPSEKFNILGQDQATLLGVTVNTPSECASVSGQISIPVNLFDLWASQAPDQSITLYFVPQSDNGFNAEINNDCGGSTIDAELRITNKANSELVFQFALNGGSVTFVPIANISSTIVELQEGANVFEYFLTDCAGNTADPYTFTITIEDTEPPVLVCPGDDNIVLTGDDNCVVEDFQLPLPLQASDNCPADQTFAQLQPSVGNDGVTLDSLTAYLRFAFDNDNGGIYKNVFGNTYNFTGLVPNALDSVSFQVIHRGDFDTQDYEVVITAQGVPPITKSLVGQLVGDCIGSHTATVKISRDEYNTLAAANGTITVAVNPTTPFDLFGTNPCASPIDIGGSQFIDSVSFFSVNLTYTNWAPAYEGTGATTFTGQFEGPDFDPVEDLNLGVTTITYTITDAAGLTSSCSYDITVTDGTAPIAVGQPGEVEIVVNPGQEILVLDPADFDNGSSDNCTDSATLIRTVSPAQIDCDEVVNGDKSIIVTLTVEDEAGLTDAVQVNVRLVQAVPEPTFNLEICTGDTLFLFANPPENFNGNTLDFTYEWSGPDGFVSFERDPIIINPTGDNAGTYTVTVFGDQTGCSAVGVVQVAVDDLSPDIISQQGQTTYCEGETISLTTNITPGADRTFNWYQGIPGSGTLVQSDANPILDLGTPAVGSQTYYLEVATSLCTSEPSETFTYTVNSVPVAQPDFAFIDVCDGDEFNLNTSQTADAYLWTGPNGFSSTLAQTPAIVASPITRGNGIYELVVTVNGCTSAPATVQVSLLNKPPTPELAALPLPNVCEGTNLTLTAVGSTGARDYFWISPQLTTVTTTTNTLDLGPADLSMSGTWRVFTQEDQCFSDESDPITVTVNALPNVAAGATATTVCEGNNIELIASPTIPGAVYNWSGPVGVSIPSGQNPVISNAALSFAGTYTLEIITPEGCSNTDQVNISVLEGITVTDIIVDAPVCSQGPATVTLTPVLSETDPGTFQYEWTGINGFSSTEAVATLTNATVLASGPYSLQVTDDKGCKSNVLEEVVNLTFAPAAPAIPLPPPGADVQFCVGETIELLTASTYTGTVITYSWFTPRGAGTPIETTGPNLNLTNATLDDSGPYSVQVTVDGCTSTISGSINLTVTEQPTVTATNNGPVCEGSELILTGSEVPGATYNWQGPGFSSTQRVAVIPSSDMELNEGTYELTVDLNGCTATTTTSVDILEVPENPDIFNNGPICVPKSTKVLVLEVDSFTAVPGATYIWSGPAGIADTTTALRDTILTSRLPTVEGTYEFSFSTLANGCESTPEIVEVTINTVPDQEAFAGLDSAFCEGELIRLDADAPTIGTGAWTVIDPELNPEVNITDPGNPNTSLSGLLPGKTYTFRWALSNGACFNYDQQDVNITVNANVELNAGEDIFLCEGELAELQGLQPSEGNPFWTQELTQQELGITITDINEPGTTIEGLKAGNVYQFTLNLETACGVLTDDMLLTVYDNAPFAGADFEVCSPDRSAQLDAVTPQGGSTGRWTSPNAEIRFSDVTSPTSTAFNLEIGQNVLIWELDNGNCGTASRDTVVVTMRLSPVAADDEASVDFLRSVAIGVLANDAFPEEGTTITIISNPQFGTVEVVGDTVYYFHIDGNVGQDQFTYQIQSLDCPPSTATVRVNIGGNVQPGDCFIPSIITPNGDGINDEFLIPCLAPGTGVTGSVVIFNRWGSELFNSDDYQNDWRGVYQGADVPAGVYFYRVEFSDPNEPPQSGFIYVKR